MATGDSPGKLVGAGRSADVFELDEDRVLRRFRFPYDVRAEAELMIYLDRAGFPVPKVYDADGTDLVMERLDGRDMLAELAAKPWLAKRSGEVLADMHNRLHKIEAPAGLRPFGNPDAPSERVPGDKVLHMDLHPGNIMLTSRGPVVIDWTSVAAGPAGADVATAYLIMASSEVDDLPLLVRLVLRPVRATVLRTFRAAAHDDPAPHMAAAARVRMRDPNVRPAEADALLRMAQEAEQTA